MSDKLEHLDARQLRALMSTLVGLGVNEIDADQTLTTLVDDVEDQDVELEFNFKGRPITVVVKANMSDNASPEYSIVSDENEISSTLAAVL